jgi:hypothetical protein
LPEKQKQNNLKSVLISAKLRRIFSHFSLIVIGLIVIIFKKKTENKKPKFTKSFGSSDLRPDASTLSPLARLPHPVVPIRLWPL